MDQYRSPADQPDGVPDRTWATGTPGPSPQYPGPLLDEQKAAASQLVPRQVSGARGLLGGVVPLAALGVGMAYSYSQRLALGAMFEGRNPEHVPGVTLHIGIPGDRWIYTSWLGVACLAAALLVFILTLARAGSAARVVAGVGALAGGAGLILGYLGYSEYYPVTEWQAEEYPDLLINVIAVAALAYVAVRPHRTPDVPPAPVTAGRTQPVRSPGPYGTDGWSHGGSGYGQPAQTAATNGLAIASLVLGILWLYWLGSLLAVVFGHIALGQIRRAGGRQSGRGLALVGAILGGVGLAVLAVGVAVLVAASGDSYGAEPALRAVVL